MSFQGDAKSVSRTGVLLSKLPSHPYTPFSTLIQGNPYMGYPELARMCFALISILVLSNISGLEVMTSTEVIMRRSTSGSSSLLAARLSFL